MASVPAYDHIVVVVEENHNFDEIIGSPDAPYINSLASGGALLTNYSAISHPSEPNYFALYAGSTFGVTDDNAHSEPDPTLATILQNAGQTFTGFIEPDSPAKHNPWESFPEGFNVEQNFSQFPNGNFSALPSVSFVVPDLNDDMHDGTVAQGDTWLANNINSYAQWAQSNNSLLVVTWDENDLSETSNQVATILYGADVVPGQYNTPYNHYNLLSTITQSFGLNGPNNAANATPITEVFGQSPPPAPPPPPPQGGPLLVENTENSYHYATSDAVNTVSGTDYSFAASVQSSDRHITIAMQTPDGASGECVDYDLTTGTVGTEGGWGAPVAAMADITMTPQGNGYLLTDTFTASDSQPVIIAADLGNGGMATAYQGDGSSGVEVDAISLTVAGGANQWNDFGSWDTGHAQLVQAMASFNSGAAAENSSSVTLGTDPVQQTLLTTPHQA
jgi:hypothetical protein